MRDKLEHEKSVANGLRSKGFGSTTESYEFTALDDYIDPNAIKYVTYIANANSCNGLYGLYGVYGV